jgi:transposase
MATYEVDRPDGAEGGISVTCTEHGEQEHFQPGRARVTFYCPDCEYEVEVALHDALDGRPWGEKC